ncbi:vitamin K-dependent protein S-like [Herpailurus yagouaroundi]|uniref:vitamin K-dependent protein S-like n=1 Tax=Herpailurus yagouaroundi TaxID=1608482 RepID=UPI001AD62E59|nr:vitamin K-dependent protein S-like [Puma yagouaroundi]
MFALVSGYTVPFALSLVDSASEKLQDILVSIENMVVSRVEAISLCSNEQFHLEVRVNRTSLELLTPLKKDIIYSEDLQSQLAILDIAMKERVSTYLGGLPGIFLLFFFFKVIFKTSFKVCF